MHISNPTGDLDLSRSSVTTSTNNLSELPSDDELLVEGDVSKLCRRIPEQSKHVEEFLKFPISSVEQFKKYEELVKSDSNFEKLLVS